jgi:hypothetical protein
VNIRLSVDGDYFSMLLASNTPNDGSEAIVVPNVTAKNCRILIEPVGNIYYVVNSTALPWDIQLSLRYLYIRSSFCYSEQVAYTTRTITVPSTLSSVADINFNVSLTHSYLSDVEMEVISPQGTTVKFDRSCGNTNSTLLLSYDDSGLISHVLQHRCKR